VATTNLQKPAMKLNVLNGNISPALDESLGLPVQLQRDGHGVSHWARIDEPCGQNPLKELAQLRELKVKNVATNRYFKDV